MEETPVTIIGIIIAVIIMLIVPLIMLADRSDDIAQLLVQTETAEFVDEVIKTGKITNDTYYKFVERLQSSGNIYDIDIELKILDENTSKYYITSGNPSTKIGSNTYYSIYTSQIEDMLNSTNNEGGKIVLKQGDAISITVSNNSKTLSQALKSFYSGVNGTNIKIITATASGTVAINGTK